MSSALAWAELKRDGQGSKRREKGERGRDYVYVSHERL